jgi:hypothetical protein
MQTLAKTNVALKPKHIVDTHRHPLGPKLIAKMVERGLYDPKSPFHSWPRETCSLPRAC